MSGRTVILRVRGSLIWLAFQRLFDSRVKRRLVQGHAELFRTFCLPIRNEATHEALGVGGLGVGGDLF